MLIYMVHNEPYGCTDTLLSHDYVDYKTLENIWLGLGNKLIPFQILFFNNLII